MGDKKRLARAGLEVMDRLDLPGELAAGLSDVTLKLYPGLRHEILNEGLMRQTVYEDIWHWLEPHLPAR